MIKSKTNSVTLAGAYIAITDSTIPLFKAIQFENDTGSPVDVKFNSDTNSITYANGQLFFKNSEDVRYPFRDIIYANGTGTIKIEIEYDT